MEGQNTAQMSELQQKLAAAREQSQKKAEIGLNKVEGKRTEYSDSIKKAKEAAEKKVKEFRAWDRKTSIKVLGDVGSLPEVGKILAAEGKDKVVEGGKNTLRWAEARGNDIANFAEETKDKAVNSVNAGIEKTKQKYNAAKESTIGFFVQQANETKRAFKGFELGVVQEWRKNQNEWAEKKSIRQYEKAEKIQEKADKAREKYNKSSENVLDLRGKLQSVRLELDKNARGI